MSMKGKLLGGAVLLMVAFSLNEAQATSCARLPSCEQLGYTMKKADCGETPVLRCPFALSDDSQVFCRKEADGEPVVAEPIVTEPVVTLGAILYGDGTVSTEIISDKTPIGIVFDTENRLAVALTDVKSDGSAGSEEMKWSEKGYDVPNLENCDSITSGTGKNSDGTAELCGVDGRGNTDKILACGSSCGGTPAATACNLYQPTGCTQLFCQKGKWFLPSLRDLNSIYLQKAVINATLSALGRGSLLDDRPYWCSTEKANLSAWGLNMYDGGRSGNFKNHNGFYVRPVVAF